MYKLPIIQMYNEQMNEIEKNQYPVIVFGSGMLGRAVVDLLLEKNISIECIFDNNEKNSGESYRGIEISLPKKINDKNVVYIVAVYSYMESVTKQLEEMGCEKIYPYYCCFDGQTISEDFYWNNDGSIQDAAYYEACSKFDENDNPLIIDSLDLAITEKCSLKCENCANLIQYYDKPLHGNVEDNIRALKRLVECVDLIGRVHILGGEPLLCKELPEYVQSCIDTEKIVNILVVSNGTLSVKEELKQVLKKDDRCIFSISNYGELSRKKEEIIELSRSAGFKLAVSRREGLWRELGRIEYIDLTNEELREKWKSCTTNKFLSLKNGKLFICPFASNAYSLQAVRKEDVEYIDLLDENISIDELREKIRIFINKDIHFECKYCIEKGNDAKIVPAAVQIKEPMNYIKYTY